MIQVVPCFAEHLLSDLLAAVVQFAAYIWLMTSSQATDKERQIRQWFDAIDVDKNGELDAQELQRALSLGNLHFSLKAVGQMVRIHDSDRSGTISFCEFEQLHSFLSNMQASFIRFDCDKSGELDEAEISFALQHAGFQLDPPAFSALFQSFDAARKGSLALSEYIGLTLFLQSASATFRAFDVQQQGTIMLNFNQWIYAASNVI